MVLGGGPTATTENGAWLDGERVSRAELTRTRMKHSAEKELAYAVQSRPNAGFDAGHWSWQPVGGRASNPLLKRETGTAKRGSLRAMENRSNVDLVVFGHEQDDFDGEGPAPDFECTIADWMGSKHRVGALDANNSRVDSIVFGVDLDGFDQTPAEVEAELRGMPEFSGAAGLVSMATRENKPLSKVFLDEPPPPTFYGKLRNAGDVDEVRGRGRLRLRLRPRASTGGRRRAP